jgi:hypothetical protein
MNLLRRVIRVPWHALPIPAASDVAFHWHQCNTTDVLGARRPPGGKTPMALAMAAVGQPGTRDSTCTRCSDSAKNTACRCWATSGPCCSPTCMPCCRKACWARRCTTCRRSGPVERGIRASAKLFHSDDSKGLDLCRRHALVAAQPCELRLVSSELRVATLHRNGGIRSLQRLPDDCRGVSMYEFGRDAQNELVLAAVGVLVDVLRHPGNGRTDLELQGSTSSRGPRCAGSAGARLVPSSYALKSRCAVDSSRLFAT